MSNNNNTKIQYISNTNGIEVIVSPEYINSQLGKNGNLFVWAYHVEIENKSNEVVQLVNRYWKIIDEAGGMQEINGLGAVGEQPILAPNENFKYSSGVHLQYPSGIMSGHYGMKRPNGEVINVEIPSFSLDVPGIEVTVN
ncbi:MAG: efflux protein ApaG [Rickettsiaceae bacterium]|jgi:ApaG protein|nr:efflux protein ApaG [Rickettsiaceae bacterium]